MAKYKEDLYNQWNREHAWDENNPLREEMLQYRRIQVQLAAVIPIIAVALLQYISTTKETNPYILLIPIAILTFSLYISTSIMKSKIRMVGYFAFVIKSPWEIALILTRRIRRESKERTRIKRLLSRIHSWIFDEGWLGRFQKAFIFSHILIIGISAAYIYRTLQISVDLLVFSSILGLILIITLVEQARMRKYAESIDDSVDLVRFQKV